jgi:hypothetical protein
MIVAPILAIMSYLATDYIVSEKPHIAKDGNIYKMRVNSNCRWDSGKCTLDNEDIKIDIIGTRTNNLLILNLSSNVLLNSIKVDFDKHNIPNDMKINKNDFLKWDISLPLENENKMLNFAITINRSIFLAQISTIFIKN